MFARRLKIFQKQVCCRSDKDQPICRRWPDIFLQAQECKGLDLSEPVQDVSDTHGAMTDQATYRSLGAKEIKQDYHKRGLEVTPEESLKQVKGLLHRAVSLPRHV